MNANAKSCQETMDQLRNAFFIVWIVISVIACCILVVSFFLPQGLIYDLTPECEWQAKYGKPCPLCGMTHSFFLISSGRFSEAVAFNQYSLFLYGLFCVNGILFLFNVFRLRMIDSRRKYLKTLLIR